MSKRKSISIPAPIALPGQVVKVLNYRMRPNIWEKAKVDNVTYSPSYEGTLASGGGTYQVPEHWRYEVWIDRPFEVDAYGRRRGGGYRITVGDDAIREEVAS